MIAAPQMHERPQTSLKVLTVRSQAKSVQHLSYRTPCAVFLGTASLAGVCDPAVAPGLRPNWCAGQHRLLLFLERGEPHI